MKEFTTIWLDMDGVLVDFLTGAHRHVVPTTPIDLAKADAWGLLGCDTSEFWTALDKHGPAFWSELPAFEKAPALINWARANAPRVGICTAPPKFSSELGRKYCHQGKVEWLHRHGLGDLPMMFTKEKHILANDRALLIDDLPGNCRNFTRSGGTSLTYPRAWNTGHHDLTYFDTTKLA